MNKLPSQTPSKSPDPTSEILSSRPISSLEVVSAVTTAPKFDVTQIKNFPRSNRKVSMRYGAFGLPSDDVVFASTQSMHISPQGIEFCTTEAYAPGALLRIHLDIPDYWQRKLRFVQYRRVDQPARFPILAKVISSEAIGRRGKKKVVTVQTVSIDETDELVLRSFLQEG